MNTPTQYSPIHRSCRRRAASSPHNRFSIKAKRSEVLFVDYMAEHLTPAGRAGIIVPEGIIFQSQNALQTTPQDSSRRLSCSHCLASSRRVQTLLRRQDLNPDTRQGHRTQDRPCIAFFKVENDGYDLGAQRRPIAENDLPQVQADFAAYVHRLRSNEPLEDFQPRLGLVIDKSKIATDGEYNLSGERYMDSGSHVSRFEVVQLGEVATIIAGQSPPGRSYNDKGHGVPFYQGKTEFGELYIGEPKKWTTDPRRFAEVGDILMSVRAPVGPVNLAPQKTVHW